MSCSELWEDETDSLIANDRQNPVGCFQKWGYSKMDGLEWKTLLKWMIWGYHHFWKHPIVQKLHLFSTLFVLLSKQLFVEASSFGTDASCALSTDRMSLKVCPPSWPSQVLQSEG